MARNPVGAAHCVRRCFFLVIRVARSLIILVATQCVSSVVEIVRACVPHRHSTRACYRCMRTMRYGLMLLDPRPIVAVTPSYDSLFTCNDGRHCRCANSNARASVVRSYSARVRSVCLEQCLSMRQCLFCARAQCIQVHLYAADVCQPAGLNIGRRIAAFTLRT